MNSIQTIGRRYAAASLTAVGRLGDFSHARAIGAAISTDRCTRTFASSSGSSGQEQHGKIRRTFASSSDGGDGTNTSVTSDVPVHANLKNPIVAQLWKARHEAKQRLSLTDQTQQGGGSQTTDLTKAAAAVLKEGKQESPKAGSESVGKPPSVSETSIEYPFSTDEYLSETYRNPWGEMRFGKILEDLDALAGNIAFSHVDGNPLIVTAGVDRIRLRHQPPIGEDQVLSGKVTFTGNSSMEIRMQICTKGCDECEWLEAYFTFVVLDPDTKRPIKIAPLLPQTSEERAQFELGALKARNKKMARRGRIVVGKQLTEEAIKIDKLAAELLEQASTSLRMPSLADPNVILMGATEMQNAMVAQPQVRNLHDRIFGGFLMRRAYELAFAACYLFGGDKPRFLEVDDISFDAPVNVGELLVFKSRCLYTQPDGGDLGEYVQDHDGMPLVSVEVETWVTSPENCTAKLSNHFYFTFALPNKKTCRTILPGNIDQARSMAARITADRDQASFAS